MTTAPDYLQALALASAQVIAAAHRAEPVAPYIRAALSLQGPEGTDRFAALVHVLACQVDPDTDLATRLAWVRGFDPMVVDACVRSAA